MLQSLCTTSTLQAALKDNQDKEHSAISWGKHSLFFSFSHCTWHAARLIPGVEDDNLRRSPHKKEDATLTWESTQQLMPPSVQLGGLSLLLPVPAGKGQVGALVVLEDQGTARGDCQGEDLESDDGMEDKTSRRPLWRLILVEIVCALANPTANPPPKAYPLPFT